MAIGKAMKSHELISSACAEMAVTQKFRLRLPKAKSFCVVFFLRESSPMVSNAAKYSVIARNCDNIGVLKLYEVMSAWIY
ncbi:MAG: hypothetical protein B7X06_03070 [Verrucomicrobia bacterium 21-51-4]|nr:MAG: hypothetical protein B7X06_03070 [Verrucomicrobia bacterium 21-51-4]